MSRYFADFENIFMQFPISGNLNIHVVKKKKIKLNAIFNKKFLKQIRKIYLNIINAIY